jgi:hypothetical protein
VGTLGLGVALAATLADLCNKGGGEEFEKRNREQHSVPCVRAGALSVRVSVHLTLIVDERAQATLPSFQVLEFVVVVPLPSIHLDQKKQKERNRSCFVCYFLLLAKNKLVLFEEVQ